MSEEEQIGVADDVNFVEQSSLQASDGEALISSSLLKTRTMMTEEEEIGVAVEIEPVEHCLLHLPDFINLGSSYDKKAHEIDEGDNGLVDEVEVIGPQCGMIFDTADEAYNFYNGYARKIDFSVRKQRTNKSSKGEDSTTKAMTRSKPLKEVEEDENAHDTSSTQGPHVEQPNMEATVGMNAFQVPNVAWCL
ncbi:hypothetical protein RHGRI_009136 [Rhododendron griersonianum]|uniref:Uncharacterized protein n=1 Tax=Rhododendron griersonianum TaxID=479676 RepID=A0AAV6L3Z4_9ERIC|nr:hypothetical protein RHGRI_009136 [Rhododendron griersonianum]